jgi:ABC-2 type transport system permease protein
VTALTGHAGDAHDDAGAAVASSAPLPGLLVAVRVEVSKLTAQLTLRAALTLCVVLPVGFAIGMRAQSGRPMDTLFGRWAGQSGFATSLTLLSWATAWGAPLLGGLLAGDIFANEDRHGTWKMILTRSMTRSRIFAGKAIAATICVWGAFALLGVSSVLAGLIVIGRAPLVGLSGQLIAPGHALGMVAAAWGMCLLWTSFYVTLGLLFSIAARSGIVGVLGPLVVAIILQLLDTIASGRIARTLLPSTPSDAWHTLFTEPVHTGPLVQALVTTVIYTAALGVGSWLLLTRRDFAGAAARPTGQRRTTIRIGIALAAVTAVLVGIGGVGPTALTASALNRSLAQTFGNLTQVSYTWRTGNQADTATPWHAVCARGLAQVGLTSPHGAKGPGDDWACVITDLRAADGIGANTLDVTFRANGCYTAASPPGAVGALYITNNHGKQIINPLFAFDGCLGTP